MSVYLCCIFLYFPITAKWDSARDKTWQGAEQLPPTSFWRNELQNLPQKYAKFAAFTEFMVICVALLMLLNLHLTNGIQLPPGTLPASLQTAPQRAPFRRWNKRSACARFACPFYLSLSVCLSVCCPFLAIFQNIFSYILYIAISICVFDDTDSVKLENQTNNDAAHEVPRHANANREWELLRIFECNYNCRCYSDYSCSLQSSGRQTGRLAKLNTPSNSCWLCDYVCLCVLGLQITYRVGERGRALLLQ